MQGVEPIRPSVPPPRPLLRALLCVCLLMWGSAAPVAVRAQGGGERFERERLRDELRQQAIEERMRRREALNAAGGERRGYFVPPGMPGPGQPAPGNPYRGNPHQGSPYPGNPYQGNPDQGNPYQAPPHRGQPYPGQPYPGQPYPGRPYPVQPDPGQAYRGPADPAYRPGHLQDRGHRQRLSPEERELLREQLRERRRLYREGGDR